MKLVSVKCCNCGSITEIDNSFNDYVCPICDTNIQSEIAIRYMSSSQKRIMNGFVIDNGILTRYSGEFVDVVIPDNVIGIASEAFDEFRPYLNSVVLPKNLKEIGKCAFKDCTNLYKVTFNGCLETIGESAFENCTYLSSAILPDSVIKIGNSAFKNCMYMRTLKMSERIESIGEEAFYFCNFTNLTLPDSIQRIGDSAFYRCIAIEELKIPRNLKNIGNSTFEGCARLKKVTFPDNYSNAIKSYMFKNCISLVDIHLPENTKKIAKKAFDNCRLLNNIVLPQNLETIGESAFDGCLILENVILPDSLKTVEKKAFRKCLKLTEIKVPNGTSIDAESFSENPNIRIILPESTDNFTKITMAAEKKNIVLSNTCYELYCTNQKYGVPQMEVYNSKGNWGHVAYTTSIDCSTGRTEEIDHYDIPSMLNHYDCNKSRSIPHSLLSPDMMKIYKNNNTVSWILVRSFKRNSKKGLITILDFIPYDHFVKNMVGLGDNGAMVGVSNYNGFSDNIDSDYEQVNEFFSLFEIEGLSVKIINAPIIKYASGSIFSTKKIQSGVRRCIQVQFPI